jgi:eukaryotic-like serine/threonine-protein kinase
MPRPSIDPIPPARWPAVSSLLDAALDLPDEARTGWLEQLDRDQPELAPAVRALLSAHARRETGDFLERGPRLPTIDEPAELQPGDDIGPYRLLRPLGAGGMAHVWLAERSDGALDRQVALKLPQRFVWRPGLAERFTRERDILARLEHPHIARLYDAGVSSSEGPGGGLPYLVLEHVQGTSLTAYCDGRRLGTRARLALAMQVADAVQYAHTRLVIHRDLKPSNILVTEAGDVRLLDFGVAKLLVDETAERTQLTKRAGRAFTPEYASPEQVRGEALGTASDVYSLGVVLYELLCGQRPYRLRHDSAAQLEQAILDADPAPPSTGLDERAALLRATSLRRLRRELRGELDTIVLKALRKQPAERYANVAELLEDLRRQRDHEPVLARPESAFYRGRKFVLRNRLAVGAGSVVALALVGASGVSAWQAGIAQRQAQRALAVQTFLTDIFKSNSDAQGDPLKARQTTARELLDIGAARIERHLQADPEGRAQVLELLGDMYYDLGLDAEAAALYHRRVDAMRQAHGARDAQVARALADYAQQLDHLGRDDEQKRALEEAKSILDALGDHDSTARARLLHATAATDEYAPGAAELARGAVAIYRRQRELPDELPNALNTLGEALHVAGDLPGAEAAFRDALALLQRRPKASAVLLASLTLARVQSLQQKIAAADASYRLALQTALQANGETHVDTLHVRSWYAAHLHRTGRRAEAWPVIERARETLRAGSFPAHPTRSVNVYEAQMLIAEGRWAEARAPIDAVEAADRGRKGPAYATVLRMQGEQRTGEGRHDEARAALEKGWALTERGMEPAQRILATNGLALASARLALAEGDAAAALAALGRIAAPVTAVPLDLDGLRARILRADALLLQGQTGESLLAAQAVLDALAASPLRPYYGALEAEALISAAAAQRGQGAAAVCPRLERALALRRQTLGDTSPYTAQAAAALRTAC